MFSHRPASHLNSAALSGMDHGSSHLYLFWCGENGYGGYVDLMGVWGSDGPAHMGWLTEPG